MRAFVTRELSTATMNLIQFQHRNMQPALYRAVDTHRHIALIGINGMALNNITELVIEEDIKIPIYKQAMYAQMCRPLPQRKSRKVVMVQQMPPEADNHFQYSVYEARL